MPLPARWPTIPAARDTEAYVTGGGLDNLGGSTADSLSIMATNTSRIITVAGSLAYGGTLGFGAGVAYNDITATVDAYLEGADATITGAVTVQAENQSSSRRWPPASRWRTPSCRQTTRPPSPMGSRSPSGWPSTRSRLTSLPTWPATVTDTLSVGSLAVTANDDNSQIVADAGGVAVGLAKVKKMGPRPAPAERRLPSTTSIIRSMLTCTTSRSQLPATYSVTSQSNANIETDTIGGAVAGARRGQAAAPPWPAPARSASTPSKRTCWRPFRMAAR